MKRAARNNCLYNGSADVRLRVELKRFKALMKCSVDCMHSLQTIHKRSNNSPTGSVVKRNVKQAFNVFPICMNIKNRMITMIVDCCVIVIFFLLAAWEWNSKIITIFELHLVHWQIIWWVKVYKIVSCWGKGQAASSVWNGHVHDAALVENIFTSFPVCVTADGHSQCLILSANFNITFNSWTFVNKKDWQWNWCISTLRYRITDG